MIRKLVGLIVPLLFSPFYLSAQSMEFAPEGAKWVFSFERFNITGQVVSSGYEIIHYDRDTLIENRVCKVLERTIYQQENGEIQIRDNGFNIIWQDSTKVFWYHTFAEDDFRLLYDFDLDVGSEIEISDPYSGSFYLTLDSIFLSEINGQSLRNFFFSETCGGYSGPDLIVNEKFGATNSFLIFPETECIIDFSTFYTFECYEDIEFGTYIPNDPISSTCDITTSNEINPISDEITISPNPSSDIISVNGLEKNSKFRYGIFDPTGKLLLRGVSRDEYINITEFPPGVYFLFLEVNGRIYSSKFIKANL